LSTDRPSLVAVTLAPLPRCATTNLDGIRSPSCLWPLQSCNRWNRKSNLSLTRSVRSFALAAQRDCYVQKARANNLGSDVRHAGYCVSTQCSDGPRHRSPNYLRKAAALFGEFRDTGMSDKLKYNSAADLRGNYPDFFWRMIQPYTVDAIRYLRVTLEGLQWVAILYANVFSMEHRGQKI